MPAISTPDLCDEFAEDVRVCDLQFRTFGQSRSFYGSVMTVKCFEDNSLVKQVLSEPGKGKVLVVDGGGSLRRALLGDQIAEMAVRNGWEGLVFNSAIRDVDEINALKIGVRALGVIPRKTEKRGEGQINTPVHFGGVSFQPGEYLAADHNGVIISARELLSNIR